MTTPVVAMPRPGCFGSPTCFYATKLPCNRCPFAQSCGPVAARVSQELRVKYGIEALLHAGPRNAPAGTPGKVVTGKASSIEELPVKVREVLERTQARGIDLPRAIAMRTNPFASHPPVYMRVAVDRLLQGSFTRDELRAAFVEELGWAEGTALSHVSIATAVLFNAGVAVDQGGRITLVEEEMAE